MFPDHLRFGIHAGQLVHGFPLLPRTVEDGRGDRARLGVGVRSLHADQADPTGPCFEGMSLLAAMAAHTERLRCGIIVTGVTYRSPALLANMAATIDHVSGGRLELGIGGAWCELEHDQYGIPFPPIGERLAMMGEEAIILKSLWTERRTTFSGRHYQLKDAMCEPKPLQTASDSVVDRWIRRAGDAAPRRGRG